MRDRFLEFIKNPSRKFLFIFGTVFIVVSLLSTTGIFRNNDFLLLDLAFRNRDLIDPLERDTSIVVIEWSDPAITQVGRWPWTWDKHALLIDFVRLYDAERLGIVDNHFEKQGQISLEPGKQSALEESLFASIQQGDLGLLAAQIPDYALEMSEALARFGNGFLCATFALPEAEELLTPNQLRVWKEALERGRASKSREAIESIVPYSIPDGRGGALNAIDVTPPIAELNRAAAGVGFNRILHDPDGVVRRTPAVVEYGERLYFNLAVLMAADRYGIDVNELQYTPGEHITFPRGGPKNEGFRIPVDDNGALRINWAGRAREDFLSIPFDFLALQISIQKAKEAIQGMNLADYGYEAIVLRVRDVIMRAGLLPQDRAGALSNDLVDALVAEHFQQGGATFEEYFEQLGLNDEMKSWQQEIWDAVQVNTIAYYDLDFGDTPVYEDLLRDLGLTHTPLLHENFRKTLHFYKKGKLLNPLYFSGKAELNYSSTNSVVISPFDLTGKTVFVGLTASGLNALNPMPFQERYPMLGLQPNAYNTIVSQEFLRQPPEWTNPFFILIYTAAIVALILRLSTAGQTLSLLMLLSLHFFGSWVLFSTRGWMLPVVAPLAALVLGYGLTVLIRYVEEREERKKVRGLFSAMVSPEVLEIIEEHPEKLNLAGEKRDATMFSSDVSGFTTISEGVTAQGLAAILNVYLTPMSNIIMNYNGYVDKYEGDAIKASYGIPISDEDHPWKGVYSALEQQEELSVIARMILLKYGVGITARMGVNTGIVSAGNMGSERKRQYSTMGEQVTLAEELEPANKIYESWIAIGPETEERSRDYIESRLLDTLRLGHHVLDVYEPLGWRREKYLEYWSGKPVPALFINSWKRLTPEKILGYVHYYKIAGLPVSPMLDRVRKLFANLEDDARSAMMLEDEIDVITFYDDIKALRDEMSGLASKTEHFETQKLVTAEIEHLEHRLENTEEAWEKNILPCKIELRRYAAFEEATRGELDRQISDRLLNQIDRLEKIINSFQKRIAFPEDEDAVAVLLAENLKKLLADDKPVEKAKRDDLSRRRGDLQRGIEEKIMAFLRRLEDPVEAKAFHEFKADHCTVTEEQLRLRDVFGQARELYLQQKWDDAIVQFREALKIVPTDGPSTKYIERIEDLKKNPPPPDWDGVWEEE